MSADGEPVTKKQRLDNDDDYVPNEPSKSIINDASQLNYLLCAETMEKVSKLDEFYYETFLPAVANEIKYRPHHARWINFRMKYPQPSQFHILEMRQMVNLCINRINKSDFVYEFEHVATDIYKDPPGPKAMSIQAEQSRIRQKNDDIFKEGILIKGDFKYELHSKFSSSETKAYLY